MINATMGIDSIVGYDFEGDDAKAEATRIAEIMESIFASEFDMEVNISLTRDDIGTEVQDAPDGFDIGAFVELANRAWEKALQS